MISKKGGKVMTTQTSAVSADGKTRTVTSKGVNAAGNTVNNVSVYDGQQAKSAARPSSNAGAGLRHEEAEFRAPAVCPANRDTTAHRLTTHMCAETRTQPSSGCQSPWFL